MCLPSYPMGRRYLPYSSPDPQPSIHASSNEQMTRKTPIPLLVPGYQSGPRTPVYRQFSLSWPAVLTVSPSLINFISLSFCLMSGNSFPTQAQTRTPPSVSLTWVETLEVCWERTPSYLSQSLNLASSLVLIKIYTTAIRCLILCGFLPLRNRNAS